MAGRQSIAAARGLSACIMLLLWLSACGGSLPALARDQVRARQTVDGVTITLDTQRDPQVNQAQNFRVILTDRLDRPLDGADVYLDLDMDMLCLSGNKPIATQVGPGQYELDSLYQMPGEWEVTVYATLKGQEHKALFLITVVDAPESATPAGA